MLFTAWKHAERNRQRDRKKYFRFLKQDMGGQKFRTSVDIDC